MDVFTVPGSKHLYFGSIECAVGELVPGDLISFSGLTDSHVLMNTVLGVVVAIEVQIPHEGVKYLYHETTVVHFFCHDGTKMLCESFRQHSNVGLSYTGARLISKQTNMLFHVD